MVTRCIECDLDDCDSLAEFLEVGSAQAIDPETKANFRVMRHMVGLGKSMFSGMLPHQQRVIEEKKELDDKATKLSNFIGSNPMFLTLDADEQMRMKEQCEIMWQYSEILGKRIAAFN